MSISNSLHSGVSGLNSNSESMAVIANNIANANTKSFKTDRAEFEDMLALSINDNVTIGRGSRLRNTSTMHTQGALTTTGAITDMAVQGDGFFITKNPKSDNADASSLGYTRAGSFRFNREGFLTDVDGNKIQGYMAESATRLTSKLGDLQIVNNSIPPVATSQLDVAVNLDCRVKPMKDEFDPMRPSDTSNHQTTLTIYDNWGAAHLCTVYFSKVDDPSQNLWKWNATVDGTTVADGPGLDDKGRPIPAVIAQGEISFDPDGKPMNQFVNRDGKQSFIDVQGKSDAFEVQFANGAQSQKIQFNFGASEDENGIQGVQSSTSIASASASNFHSQNGYESGSLKAIKIDLDGNIRGVYTNGREIRMGAIALASFSNVQGLQKMGRNTYLQTPLAGAPRIGLPQTGQRGSIYSAALEESNVDLAQQFVEMITTQRGFQANSKSITTTDTLMEEVLNLKR